MITCLKLKGKHSIGLNSSNQIDVDGTNVSIKEIPFVRYDFDTYSDEELSYILKTIEKFKLSTHLIQFKAFSGSLIDDLNRLSVLEGKVAKYLYFNLSQADLALGQISNEQIAVAMNAMQSYTFDRIMIIDSTDEMTMVTAKQIIKTLSKQLGIKEGNIGICNSPLCMSDNLACLTAVTAREVASKYSTNDVVATPSANHQCMNCCGCIRFYEVTSDISAPADTKTKKPKKEKTEKADKTSTKQTKNSKVLSLKNFV